MPHILIILIFFHVIISYAIPIIQKILQVKQVRFSEI